MKKSIIGLIVGCYLVGCFYLIQPVPDLPPLPNSRRSTEPGDSGQIRGVVAAYYTNLSRQEVINFYRLAFQKSAWGLPRPAYKLNHPPEYARTVIIDTIKGNFLEELVHPLSDSLFINGWILKDDQQYLTKTKNPLTYFEVDGQQYRGKITLYLVNSYVGIRMLIWTVIFVLAGQTYFWLRRLLKQ